MQDLVFEETRNGTKAHTHTHTPQEPTASSVMADTLADTSAEDNNDGAPDAGDVCFTNQAWREYALELIESVRSSVVAAAVASGVDMATAREMCDHLALTVDGLPSHVKHT